MRLLIRIGLVPEPERPLSVVQASAEHHETAVGRWFATNLDLKTVIAGLSIAAGMLTTYVASTNNRTADHDQLSALVRKEDEDRKQAADARADLLRQMISQHQEDMDATAAVNARFDKTVVSREEYQNFTAYTNSQFAELRAYSQLPLVTRLALKPGR